MICYTFIGLAMHRKPDGITRFLDYSVLVPRAVPGLLAGLGAVAGGILWKFTVITKACHQQGFYLSQGHRNWGMKHEAYISSPTST